MSKLVEAWNADVPTRELMRRTGYVVYDSFNARIKTLRRRGWPFKIRPRGWSRAGRFIWQTGRKGPK